ncbi:carbamoyltransferase [Micromonospora sp. Llam0]|uniref:carbamoyltransferase family protein n=1 Tax=Micromonospora sp. Llam0 TaxID=2485143 RepID=UPI000FA8EB76|nr:carbamoyltransferase C-terminal domain-containing protein [Micromonospora sp. Llam0]ROO59673.1 carbamoyltransferase [Micromonospora sp. Llam0]
MIGDSLTPAPPPQYRNVQPTFSGNRVGGSRLSGFDEALVVVADGMGEQESLSVFEGRGAALRRCATFPIMSSLGILYSVFTHYLGFQAGMDEYKVMGLAPYGDRDRHRAVLDEFVQLKPDGDFAIPLLSANKSPLERETHQGVLRLLEERLGPARSPDSDLTSHHMDVAAALQATLERTLLHVLGEHRRRTGLRRLCMAGGVALNCTANGVVLRSGLFDEVFIQPAAGDDGSALGAALYALRQERPAPPTGMRMPYWGDGPTAAEVDAALRDLGPGFESSRYAGEQLIPEVIGLVERGATVALCQGRMEFGPRALGNRSILADPRSPTMRAHLNTVVKQREEFRPFAPAVSVEDAATYFDIAPGTESAYRHMLTVTGVRPPFQDRLPAVTHVDGSARVQVVERDSAPLFWGLLREMGRRTGLPVLVNTSFNLRGQPIVRTAVDAVATFARSTLDALVIGDVLVRRVDVGPAGTGRAEPDGACGVDAGAGSGRTA